jgi:rare lipoprotein A (peptidoglycan hydrolase)
MVLGGKDDPQKPLALYRTASIGSFIKVINPLNGKSISVRVVGKITEEKDANILIKLSKYACDQIDAKEEQFKVLIEYQQQ